MERFFGDDLAIEELEQLALEIHSIHRSDQAALMRSRWFDYAFMHPVTATYLFAHLYRHYAAEWVERHVDMQAAQELRDQVAQDVFEGPVGELTSLWLARSCADGLGVPYGVLLRFCFDRAFQRQQRTFPRPNQLYGEEIEIDLAQHWRETVERSIQYSRIEKLQARQEVRCPEWHRHQDFVMGQILARMPDSHVSLLGRMFHERVLLPSTVVNHFPDAVVSKALDLSAALGAQSSLTATL